MVRKVRLLAAVCALAIAAGTAQTAAAEACQRQYHSVYVELDMSRYPETTGHYQDAIADGHAALLHIDRENAELHREQSLVGFPPRPGYDRDEYPPAMSEEGGYGADIRYIDPSDNRGAGSSMGNQLEDWCEEQPFRISFVP
jgi:Deoxyribonuclease NucA/NucB